MSEISNFESYRNSHTPEDFSKLMGKILQVSLKRTQALSDKACANGNHGFHTKTWLGGGSIHTRCTNCGKSWGRLDVPFM